MTQIETIIAEIERLMNWKPKAIPSGMRQRDVLNIRKGVLLTLKAFINSLPAEQPSEELERENLFTTATKVFCSAQCISDWNHDLEETRYMNLKQKGKIHNNEKSKN